MNAGRIATTLLLAALLVGCAEPRDMFFIQLVKVPSTDCNVDSSEDGYYRTAGVLDLAFSWQYFLTPLLRNQLSPRGSADDLRTEVNGIQVEGANIQLWQGGRPYQGNAFDQFYQPAASYVHPGGVTATGFVAIRTEASAQLLETVLSEGSRPVFVTVGVRMLGTTSGGIELETPEFFFTVRLCYGCLVTCPESSRPSEGGGLCESTEVPPDAPCWLGQDAMFDCRFCTPIYGAPSCRDFCATF